MANIKCNEIDFNTLGVESRKFIVDLLYPVGTYFITDSSQFDTVEKVQAHFGVGGWTMIRKDAVMTLSGKAPVVYDNPNGNYTMLRNVSNNEEVNLAPANFGYKPNGGMSYYPSPSKTYVDPNGTLSVDLSFGTSILGGLNIFRRTR